MIHLTLIRHGATAGNLERRYIGRTDEPLCEAGVTQAEGLKNAGISAEYVFISPMLRTRQTAEILFPGQELIPVSGMQETNFGIFEGKTADELSSVPEYQTWVDSWCQGPVPEGESTGEFKARCCEAFRNTIQILPDGAEAAFVVHGGTIMAVLEEFAYPKKDFYDYHIANGSYISAVYENGVITIAE